MMEFIERLREMKLARNPPGEDAQPYGAHGVRRMRKFGKRHLKRTRARYCSTFSKAGRLVHGAGEATRLRRHPRRQVKVFPVAGWQTGEITRTRHCEFEEVGSALTAATCLADSATCSYPFEQLPGADIYRLLP